MGKLYTLEQVAGLLQVSYTTVWREVRDGKLGAKRVRGQLRVSEEEYQAYLKNLPNSEKQSA